VLTNQPIDSPDELAAMIESLTASPEEVIRQLSQRGFHHLYIDGGKTIQNFLTAGLINQLIITRVPILIGSGIPLFGALPGDIKLRNIKTRHFSNGLVQTNYEVLRPAP
jgi:dihydrofolate reductase